jgi:hypothetical protein
VADGYKCEPPREVTLPDSPQNISVDCSPLLSFMILSGMDRTGQICPQNDKDRMRLVRLCRPIREEKKGVKSALDFVNLLLVGILKKMSSTLL